MNDGTQMVGMQNSAPVTPNTTVIQPDPNTPTPTQTANAQTTNPQTASTMSTNPTTANPATANAQTASAQTANTASAQTANAMAVSSPGNTATAGNTTTGATPVPPGGVVPSDSTGVTPTDASSGLGGMNGAGDGMGADTSGNLSGGNGIAGDAMGTGLSGTGSSDTGPYSNGIGDAAGAGSVYGDSPGSTAGSDFGSPAGGGFGGGSSSVDRTEAARLRKRQETVDAAQSVPPKNLLNVSTVEAAPIAATPRSTVAEQVSKRLAPLRKGPDGIHRLTIRLNPEGLGPISVVAEVRGGAIAVRIHGSTEAGVAALHATLPDLRRDLTEAGFGSCSLDIQQGEPEPGPAPVRPRIPNRASVYSATTKTPGTVDSRARSALDLRILKETTITTPITSTQGAAPKQQNPVVGSVKDWVGRTDASMSTKATDPNAAPVAGGSMDKDTFLKLLVAQLKYQDPDKPADGTQFVSETAEFTSVEKLTDLATAQQSLLNAQLQLGGAQMIGHQVDYTDANGKSRTGTVTAATVNSTNPTVRIGDTDIALSAVREVRDGDSAGATPLIPTAQVQTPTPTAAVQPADPTAAAQTGTQAAAAPATAQTTTPTDQAAQNAPVNP